MSVFRADTRWGAKLDISEFALFGGDAERLLHNFRLPRNSAAGGREEEKTEKRKKTGNWGV